MIESRWDTVVVGGGVSGMTAAHSLRKRGLRVVVLERAELGGRARSQEIDGVILDLGAQFISDFYLATLDLLSEVGLQDSLVRREQTAFIFRDMSPRPVWPAPALLSHDGLSASAKIRLLLLIPALLKNWTALDIADLQRAVKLERRTVKDALLPLLGSEASENFFAPLLRGLLYWEVDKTSSAIVLAILKAFLRSKATYRLEGGLSSLIDALATDLDTREHSEVVSIDRDGPDNVVVQTGQDETIRAGSVVIAVPAPVAARICPWLPSDSTDFLNGVSYSSTAMLTFDTNLGAGYPSGAVLFPDPAVTDLSSLNPVHSSSKEQRLVNVYLSTAGYQRYAGLSDPEMAQAVLSRVHELTNFPWAKESQIVNIQRWPMALPEFNVGHLRGVRQFRDRHSSEGRLAFAGDYLDGPYLDGAVRSGRAASRLLNFSA